MVNGWLAFSEAGTTRQHETRFSLVLIPQMARMDLMQYLWCGLLQLLAFLPTNWYQKFPGGLVVKGGRVVGPYEGYQHPGPTAPGSPLPRLFFYSGLYGSDMSRAGCVWVIFTLIGEIDCHSECNGRWLGSTKPVQRLCVLGTELDGRESKRPCWLDSINDLQMLSHTVRTLTPLHA
jgi:hypothetical protein